MSLFVLKVFKKNIFFKAFLKHVSVHPHLHDSFLTLIGALNKLNRKFKYSNENNRLQSERSSKIENSVMQLLKETKEIKTCLLEFNFHIRMDTVDISDYFPLQTDEQLSRFMKADDEWNQRKKESI